MFEEELAYLAARALLGLCPVIGCRVGKLSALRPFLSFDVVQDRTQ